jgi:hypothetical protein
VAVKVTFFDLLKIQRRDAETQRFAE